MLVSQQPIAGKQQDIIQAAKTLFLSNGYGNTSMDAIAAKAAVTKQTVYRYYPSKEELFSAVMQYLRDKGNTAYQFTDGPLQAELISYGCWLLEFHLRPEALGLYRLVLAEGRHNKKLLATFRDTGPKRVIGALETFLQRRYPDHSELPFAANMFCTMVLAARSGVLMGYTRSLGKQAIRDHVVAVVNLFVPMLANPDGGQPKA